MSAKNFDLDVLWRETPLPPMPAKRPQARHRNPCADDIVWGREPTPPPSPPRPRPVRSHNPVSRPPKLSTIWENFRLRCPRKEFDDPTPKSRYRFSAVYCPAVYGGLRADGRPYEVHPEQLENFAILVEENGYWINVTQTINEKRFAKLFETAVYRYREALFYGELG